MTDPQNHCQRDNVTDFTAKQKAVETAAQKQSQTEKPADPTFQEVTKATPFQPKEGTTTWLGPVADTVLIDFLFYGLFIAVPLLLMWVFFGRWWIFRNVDWIVIGLAIWFVILIGWRRKQDS